MNSTIVTAKDVAARAGVSTGTVSRVLNNHSNVNKELRKKVMEAASDLGYFASARLNSTGQNADKQFKEIGFLLTTIEDEKSIDPFWAGILHGAQTEAQRADLKVTYDNIGRLSETPYLLFNKLYEMRLDGILLVGPAEADFIASLQTIKIPMVLVDNYVPRQSVDAVLCDNFDGGRQAVEYLLEEGHRKIAFIGGPLRTTQPRPINRIYTIERRAAGYRTALLDWGVPIDYSLCESCNLTVEGGYEACKRLLKSKADFTAIFASIDKVAIGAIKALREAGRSVPDDISVVGFDDIELAEHLTPALATIRVNREAMGTVAVKKLIARAAEPQAVSVTSTLEIELVKRASVTHI